MKQLELLNVSKNEKICTLVEVADTWLMRLKGLLGTKALRQNSCLVIYPCNSVHTCFMKFNIDVLFVNEEGLILHIVENMKPFRCSKIVRGARFVIEIPAHTVRDKGIFIGEQLNINEGTLKGYNII